MNPLNAYLAQEIMHDHFDRAQRWRLAHTHREHPVRRYDVVTIRRGTPDDWTALERLAQLEGKNVPAGTALLAEVEDGVLAASWPADGTTLADPFRPTEELVALLEARARHLGARPSFVAHPLRRVAAAVRRRRRTAHS